MAKIIWTQTPTACKVLMPNSQNPYYLTDDEVRKWIQILDDDTGEPISGAELRISDLEAAVARLSNATHWLGITTTALTDGATTNPITIDGDSVTAVSGDIVQTSAQVEEFIFNGTAWQEFGASIGTLKAFAYVDEGQFANSNVTGKNQPSSVTFSGGTTDVVLGADTTFTIANGSEVTLGTPTTDKFLKKGATTTVPSTIGTTKYIKPTVGNVAIGVATSNSALTGLGTPSTTQFVTSYPGATSKLETGTASQVTSKGTQASWNAYVENETIKFSFTTNGLMGYTDKTVATGKTVASDASGSSVLTGLGTAVKADGVTGYAAPTTDTFAKTIQVTTQPTVTLSASTTQTSGDGSVAFISEVKNGSTPHTVSFTENATNVGSVVTALPATGNTAAAQTITVGTNDKPTVVKTIGTATASAQAWAADTKNITVTPKS